MWQMLSNVTRLLRKRNVDLLKHNPARKIKTGSYQLSKTIVTVQVAFPGYRLLCSAVVPQIQFR